MIVVLKPDSPKPKVDALLATLKSKGVDIHFSEGEYTTLFGIVGDITKINQQALEAVDIVAEVKRISEPYKLVNRKFHSDDTSIRVGNGVIGGGTFGVIAGPCSVESPEQIIGVAKRMKAAGAKFLRGGAFKPRTSLTPSAALKQKELSCCWRPKGNRSAHCQRTHQSAPYRPV